MRFILLILILCSSVLLHAERTNILREVFGDESRLAVVDTATQVEASILRVDDPSGGKDLNRRRYVEKGFKTLSNEVRTLIAWKLLDDRNYTWDAFPACITNYNARVRFIAGRRTVEINFCFSCAQMLVVENGVAVGGAYFEPGNDWVFRAIASEFPRDRVIRALTKDRALREIFRLQNEMARARASRAEEAKSRHP